MAEQIDCLAQLQAQLRSRREQLLRQIQADQRAPRADWGNGTFAWDAQLMRLLRDVFGLKAFRWACHHRPRCKARMARGVVGGRGGGGMQDCALPAPGPSTACVMHGGACGTLPARQLPGGCCMAW